MIHAMKAREFYIELCIKYPITLSFSEVKSFTPSQWKKAQKQFKEFYELERMVRREKEERKQKMKQFQ